MISHDLQEILNVADKIVILDEGVLVFFGKTSELLDHPDILQSYRLQLPLYLQVVYALQEKKQPVKQNIGSLEEAAAEIIKTVPLVLDPDYRPVGHADCHVPGSSSQPVLTQILSGQSACLNRMRPGSTSTTS